MINKIRVEGIYKKDKSYFENSVFVMTFCWIRMVKNLKTLKISRKEYYYFNALVIGKSAKELWEFLQDDCLYIVEGEIQFPNKFFERSIVVKGKRIYPPYIWNVSRIEKKIGVMSKTLKKMGVKFAEGKKVLYETDLNPNKLMQEYSQEDETTKTEEIWQRTPENSLRFGFGRKNKNIIGTNNIKRLEALGLKPFEDD